MSIIITGGLPSEVSAYWRSLELPNPELSMGIREAMPSGYWCGRFSTLMDRMEGTNPHYGMVELALEMLEGGCEGEVALEAFGEFRRRMEVVAGWV